MILCDLVRILILKQDKFYRNLYLWCNIRYIIANATSSWHDRTDSRCSWRTWCCGRSRSWRKRM